MPEPITPQWENGQVPRDRETAGEASPPIITVIIPTLNEAQHLAAALVSAQAANVEILVVDGGSGDATVAIATQHGCRVIHTTPGRGHQLRTGALAARGMQLLFLHADARLPAGFSEHVRRTLATRKIALGAFRLHIDGRSLGLRIVEWGVRQRCRWLSLPYGDQALFVRSETYWAIGGFRSLDALEDLEFVRRAAKFGRVSTIDAPVLVSDRAWQQRGVLRMTLQNTAVVTAYFSGFDAERLSIRMRNTRPLPGSAVAQAVVNRSPSSEALAAASDDKPTGLLFLCVANSSRSQMAEGLAQALAPPGVYIASAGSSPTLVHHLAIHVMAEIGIDISTHAAKAISSVPLTQLSAVITLCSEDVCPAIPDDVTQLHWSIDDPAAAGGTESEQLLAFRYARDQIRCCVANHFGSQYR